MSKNQSIQTQTYISTSHEGVATHNLKEQCTKERHLGFAPDFYLPRSGDFIAELNSSMALLSQRGDRVPAELQPH